MSTLVTHHEGMDRLVRGVEAVVDMLYGRGVVKTPSRVKGAEVRTAEVAPGVERPADADAAMQHIAVAMPRSLLSRWKADVARRRQDREFEALMRSDERLRSDFVAAKARAEWLA